MFYNFFDQKSSDDGAAMPANKSPANDKIKQNQRPLHLAMQQLAKEIHKPIIRKLKKKKVDFSFKVNIWGADLADMQLINKFNKGIRLLLCLMDIYS